MRSPALQPVVLADEEPAVLAGWARRHTTAQTLALRSQIMLRCAVGGDRVGEVIAKTLQETPGRGVGSLKGDGAEPIICRFDVDSWRWRRLLARPLVATVRPRSI
jgi:hypothetical protein